MPRLTAAITHSTPPAPADHRDNRPVAGSAWAFCAAAAIWRPPPVALLDLTGAARAMPAAP